MNKLVPLLIKSAPAPCVFLDYDGTLVALKKKPEEALLTPSKRKILAGLTKMNILGIVTGRGLAEIKRLVGLRTPVYIGNHGLEISYGGRTWVHPDAVERKAALSRAMGRIRVRTRDLTGALVEDKGLTLGIHFRLLARDLHSGLKTIVVDEIERSCGALKLTQGKKVFEIRPNINWDKGRGVLKVLSWLRPEGGDCPIVYIGDDETDEDAFRALGKKAWTIVVGMKKKSAARFRFRGVAEVWAFLRALRIAG